MLTSAASIVAYVAYVFAIPVIIWAVNTLEPLVNAGQGRLLQTVNGLLFAMVILQAGLILLRVATVFRENQRKEFE